MDYYSLDHGGVPDLTFSFGSLYLLQHHGVDCVSFG